MPAKTVRSLLLWLAVPGLACDTSDIGARGRWQYTCGDPVCHGYQAPVGVPACTGQRSGDPCPVLDERCDPRDDCNRLLFCSVDPPPPMPCPVKVQGREIEALGSEIAASSQGLPHAQRRTGR